MSVPEPRRRVLVIHPAMAPYRIDLLNILAQRCDLRVLFLRSQPHYNTDICRDEMAAALKCDWSIVSEGATMPARILPCRLSREVAMFRPEVLVTHEFGWATALATLTPLVRTPVARVLWTTRSPDQVVRLSAMRRAAVRLMAQRADALLAYSPASRTAIATVAGIRASQIFVCANHQNGGRLRRIAAETRDTVLERCGAEGIAGRPIILALCRLVDSKDVATTIRGFSDALQYLDDAILVVVGDGPMRDELQRCAREAHVADRVVFLGHVPAAEAQGWLSVASLTVLSSMSEPFGAVVAEGLAHGAPCICSSGAGASVLIDEPSRGIVTRPGDVSACAAALRAQAAHLRPVEDPALLNRSDLRPVTVADDAAGFCAAVEHAIVMRHSRGAA